MSKSGWFRYFIGPGIVGIIVIVAQIFINPIIARRVKTQESILEQKYVTCDKAISILQKRLASVKLTGETVPGEYEPPEASPSQFEINKVYVLLSLYCTNSSVADKFSEIVKCKGLKQSQVGEFVSQLRKEMQIKGKILDPNKFRYIYGWKPKQTDQKKEKQIDLGNGNTPQE